MENQHRCYLLIGDESAWKVAINNQIWGFSERNMGLWKTSQIGDFAAFYVTSPIKKIIGFGRIKGKFSDENIVWSDEKFFKRPIWKYKMKLDIFHVIKNWSEGLRPPENMMLNIGRKVVPEEIFKDLIRSGDKKWGTNLFQGIYHKSKF